VPTLNIGAGVTVELPAEWVPLVQVEPFLVPAWSEYVGGTGTPAGLRAWLPETTWWDLLLRLWREDRIELIGHCDLLDPERAVIALATTERVRSRFDNPEHPYGRLDYRPYGASGPKISFFDVHLRATPVATPIKDAAPVPAPPDEALTPAAQEPAAPPEPTPPDIAGVGKLEACTRLLRAAAEAAGWPESWTTAKHAIAAVRELYKNPPVLDGTSDRTLREAWRQSSAQSFLLRNALAATFPHLAATLRGPHDPKM
jgi:hypothetical protein